MATKKAAAPAKKPAPAVKPAAKSTAIEVKKPAASTALQIAPEVDIFADAGLGLENVTTKDLAIPRVSVLQSNSDQCTKGNEKFIKGAEAGDFFDNVSQDVFAKSDEGFLFIPVSFRSVCLEWIPRTKGGGFAGEHNHTILSQTTNDPETGKNMLPNGNEIVDTAEFFILVLDLNGGNPRQAVVSFAKTQLKKAKRLNTALSMLQVPKPAPHKGTFNPAMFYSVFKASTVPESNDKGNWMGWSITRYGNTLDQTDGSDLYTMAKAFHGAVASGSVKVAAPEAAGTSDNAGNGAEDETL